jgi:hypothetical protein
MRESAPPTFPSATCSEMRVLTLGVLLTVAALPALAQGIEGGFRHVTPLVIPPGGGPFMVETAELPRASRPRWWAPLASAAAPGSGQAVLGQKRWLPYLALEVWAWLQYFDVKREGSRRRREYQSLARDVARSGYPGPYPVGDFEYYEHMLKNAESGDYDLLPGGDIDPETDTTTYNGQRWLDARRLFWEDPNNAPPPGSQPFVSALEFYEVNAITPEYRWSWRSAKVEYDVFRRTIVRSNVAYKRSVEYLGVIIANHALSSVDAFVTLRLRTREGMPGYLRLEGELPMSSILPRH